MRFRLIHPIFILLTAGTALAQSSARSVPPLGKNLLAFTVGVEGIPSTSLATPANGAPRTVSQGTSLALSLQYGRRIHSVRRSEFWLDLPALVGPNHRITNGSGSLPTSNATFYVTPSLRVAFPNRSRFEPWLSGGGGYGLFETSDYFADGRNNPTIHTHTGVAQFGGGVDVRLPIRILFPVGLRGEFRDYYAFSTPTAPLAVTSSGQHGITASGGLTIHF